jgi:phosphohistidine phosphatase
MDRLILLRHGQAEPDSETGEDFDRRLAAHGAAESAAMGLRLADIGFRPDLALVSTAARARGTWDAAASAFPDAAARFTDELYHADMETIRRVVGQAAAEASTMMIVGHNPGLQELTVALLMEGRAPAGLIAKVQRNYPTAAASVFLIDNAGRPHYDGLFFPER